MEFFRENGYLAVPDALSPTEVDELRSEATRICRGELGDVVGVDVARETERDEEVLRKYLCIHFPHKISPVMFHYLGHPTIAEVLSKIIGTDVKCMQSMLFIKSAGKPGQAWHQDEDFIPTRDRSLTGGWMVLLDHLEKVTDASLAQTGHFEAATPAK